MVVEGAKKETALLIAAKYGILEMVEKILHEIPMAIHETTSDNKNILLVAVENRQPHIIKALQKNDLWENLLLGMDKEENTVIHLADNWICHEHAIRYQMVPGIIYCLI